MRREFAMGPVFMQVRRPVTCSGGAVTPSLAVRPIIPSSGEEVVASLEVDEQNGLRNTSVVLS